MFNLRESIFIFRDRFEMNILVNKGFSGKLKSKNNSNNNKKSTKTHRNDGHSKKAKLVIDQLRGVAETQTVYEDSKRKSTINCRVCMYII